MSPSEFTRVYGDSFISGFIEGGEFNALVSIKLKDRSTAKDISGQLKVQLDLKGASVDGEAEGGVNKENKSIEGETTISVSWTGGGDIKNEEVKDWTLETLKKVALEFPEHVMACPMRTKYYFFFRLPRQPLIVCSSAILTKYTGLKSFQVVMNKMGSPLGKPSPCSTYALPPILFTFRLRKCGRVLIRAARRVHGLQSHVAEHLASRVGTRARAEHARSQAGHTAVR